MALLKIHQRLGPPRAIRLPCAWLLLAVLAALAPVRAPAQQPPSTEYQVKAVFVFHFAQFVEWPASAFRDPQSPLIIGVLGEDPFGAYLDEAIRDEKVGGHPLIVRRYTRVEDVGRCHILFISSSENGRLDRIIARLRGRGILTVSDMEGFMRKGGMLQFVTESNKIRLRIDVEAAKASGLTISSKLLRRAEIVTPEN